ncbi:hypothetical protein VP01_1237g7 [Puccinia sorghi]|uniref:Uncharacterized protein n=1 Tax=Puccinia sorghi TaxID=27349 RepID=A0A0L6VR63_9BASI|nr:hypothetical protein VP01_1237g7 [Puccinia sorghi]
MNSTHYYSGHSSEHDGGAYGRDGAPAQNFMSAVAPAHRQHSTQRPNIAPSERPLPPMDRLSPSDCGHRAPAAHSPKNPFVSPLDPQISPPKAAFLEPSSPTSHSSDSHFSPGLIHGKSEKPASRDDFYHPGARWKDLERAKQQESSTWLQKQSKAGSKFKIVTWIAILAALAILGGLMTKHFIKKSAPASPPASLKWANGASEVPTFGANNTATAVPVDKAKPAKADADSSNNLGISTQSINTKRHLVALD